jgi:hypothetical protein
VDTKQIEEVNQRLSKIERQSFQDFTTLIEILSNATFFGEMKMNCEYAKEGQCSFFFITKKVKYALPIVGPCRIEDCKDVPGHFHLELSNLTCSFCPLWRNRTLPDASVQSSSGTKMEQEQQS